MTKHGFVSPMSETPAWMANSQVQADFLMTIVGNMGEALCVTDIEGMIEFVNPAALALIGLTGQAGKRINLFKFLNVSADWKAEIRHHTNERQKPLRGDDWQITRPDGQRVNISYTITSRATAAGHPLLIFLLRDITHRKQLERRLTTRERQLDSAERVTKLGSWDWDVKNDRVFWTPELFRIYGYEPDSIKPSYEIAMKHIHPEDRPRVEALIQRSVENNEPFRYTCRLQAAGGREGWMVVYGSMRFNEAGELAHMWGTAQDISEMHRLAETKERTQRFAERLVNSSLQGITAFDKDLRFLLWNPTMESLTGFEESELIGRTVSECFPEILEKREEMDLLYRVVAGETVKQRELDFVNRKTGDTYHVEINYGPLLGDGGDVMGGLIVVRDVTARKKALKALDRSLERSQAIFKAAGIGILLLDTGRNILEANPAWEEISGYPAAALIHHDFATFLERDDADMLREALNRLLDENRRLPLQREFRGLTANGETIWLSATFSRLNDDSGRPRRIVCTVENITPRKMMEQELSVVKRELARSREKERVFMAQELHDGPIQDLYATTYQLQALKRVINGEKSARLVENVLNQFNQVNETLRTICSDLRPPTLATFGLESAIRSHAERFRKLYPDLTISLDLDRDEQTLPEYARLTLFRITQEMMSNIAKHAEATQVLIRFELKKDDLVLEIQDNGNGFEVPERWIELVRDGHLGLLGASERAEEIEGSLTILSTPGRGTIVRVTAPRPEPETGCQRSRPN